MPDFNGRLCDCPNEDIISCEEDVICIKKSVDKEVLNIMDPYLKKLNEEERERFQNYLFEATLFTEREGFYIGVRYALKFLLALLTI